MPDEEVRVAVYEEGFLESGRTTLSKLYHGRDLSDS